MRIVAAEVLSTRIGVARPHQMAIGTTHHQRNVILKLYSERGEYGFGEAPHMLGHSHLGETPETVRVVLRHKLLPAVLGQPADNPEGLAQAMDKAVPGNPRAKGAIIMAAYDLAGRTLGIPVHTLLGGRVRERVPLSWSLPIVEIRTAVDEAVKMVELGFRILKVKVGRPDPEEDVEMVRALREAVGPQISIRVDANQAYGVKTALSVIRGMESSRIDFFEQPVQREDLVGMAEVTRASGIPIMADESAKSPFELEAVIRQRAADYASIYVIGTGGLLSSRKMAVLAETARMRAYVGGALESVIGVCAGVHLAAASPAIDLGCEMYGQFMLKDDVGDPLPFEEGSLPVPESPGLGCEVDESRLERHREGEKERIEWQKTS